MFPEMVGFPPKSSIFIGVFYSKPSILRYLYFRKHPNGWFFPVSAVRFFSVFVSTTLLDSSCVKFRSGSREENDAAGHSEASMVPCSALFSL